VGDYNHLIGKCYNCVPRFHWTRSSVSLSLCLNFNIYILLGNDHKLQHICKQQTFLSNRRKRHARINRKSVRRCFLRGRYRLDISRTSQWGEVLETVNEWVSQSVEYGNG
jgi:hypothetical protein